VVGGLGGAQGALAWGVLTLRWGSLVNQVARHLIEEAAASGARLAQIRGSYELEGPDLALHLRRAWQIYVPGYGGGQARLLRRAAPSAQHAAREAEVRRVLRSTKGVEPGGKAPA